MLGLILADVKTLFLGMSGWGISRRYWYQTQGTEQGNSSLTQWKVNLISGLELGNPSSTALGHLNSTFSAFQTLGFVSVPLLVLRPLALDWELHYQLPFFSVLWSWTELCHWLPWLSSLQMAIIIMGLSPSIIAQASSPKNTLNIFCWFCLFGEP